MSRSQRPVPPVARPPRAVARASKVVTAREVAQAASVSISAVSRSFTKHASVAPKTRERVLAAAQALGYRPNHLARSLMTGRTELIGLVSNHFGNPAFMPVFDAFTRQLQQRGLRPLLANLGPDGAADAALDMLLQYHVDAVLIATSAPPAGFAASCVEAGLPVLHMFGGHGARDGVPVVTVDNRAAGRTVGATMHGRGLRRLAFLGGAAGDVSSSERGQGFIEAVLDAGGRQPLILPAGDFSHEHGRLGMLELLDGQTSIDGVFCADDVLALGAIDACRERGVAVPEQLSVVGFDDMPLAAWAAYQLSTVRQPMAAMVVDAVNRIDRWLAEGVRPRSKLFACEWVERASLRPARR